MKKIDARFIARAAMIAAVYAVITLLPVLREFSFMQIQLRVSEALTVFAYLDPAAIPGLYIGAFLANLASPLGWPDFVFGSLLTLFAAFTTYGIGLIFRRFSSWAKNYAGPLVALLPVVLFNAFGVALELSLIFKIPYWPTVLTVGTGEFIAVYILGYPLLQIIMRLNIYEV
jgi:uncharacterized membrane protein